MTSHYCQVWSGRSHSWCLFQRTAQEGAVDTVRGQEMIVELNKDEAEGDRCCCC